MRESTQRTVVASLHTLHTTALGDCWFVAAQSSLAIAERTISGLHL